MKIGALASNAAVREAGDWVKNIPDMEDLELKVRGLGNADYRRLQANLLKSVSRGEKRRGSLDPETQDRIQAQLFLETILIDWKNLADNDGKPIPYSKDKAAEMLADPDLAAFRDAISYAASVVAEEDKADAEKSEKNSSKLSAGN